MQDWLKRSKLLVVVVAFLLAFTSITPFTSSAQTENELTYIGIGDSLAEGWLESQAFSNTNGYFGHIRDELTNRGYSINAINLAKNGANSTDVLRQVEGFSDYPNGADILTISVGANDILPHLIPLTEPEFQEGLTKAQITLLDFQENLNNTKDIIFKTKASFNQLIDDMNTLQDLVEMTIIDLQADPLFQQLPDAKDRLMDLEAYLDSIDSMIGEIETGATKLPSPDEELTIEKLLALLGELPDILVTANQELGNIKDHVSDTIIDVNEIQLPTELEAKYRPLIEQANTILDTSKNSIMKTQSQITESLDSLQSISLLLDNVFQALETVDQGVKKIEEALERAYGELEIIGNNLFETIEQAKAANPDVDIYILGYYNALPYTSEEFQDNAIPLLKSLNDVIKDTASITGANYVASYNTFEGRYNELLPNPNDIHPNEAGYKVLADLFIAELSDNYPIVPKEKEDEDDETNGNSETPIIKEPVEKETPKKEKVESEKLDKSKTITVEGHSEDKKEVVKKGEHVLPETATNHYNSLLIGTILISLAISSQIIHRRRHSIR